MYRDTVQLFAQVGKCASHRLQETVSSRSSYSFHEMQFIGSKRLTPSSSDMPSRQRTNSLRAKRSWITSSGDIFFDGQLVTHGSDLRIS